MERFLLKEFSKNPTVATSVYGSKSAGNPQYTEDYEQMQSLVNWEQGLGGATNNGEIQPNLNDIQAIYKVLCKAIKNNQVSGIPTYLDTETYQIGSIVLNVEKDIPYIYYSKVADNIGNPLNDRSYWGKIYFTQEFVLINGQNATFADLSQKAIDNLNNLLSFADKDLSNLSLEGQAILDNKADVDLSNLSEGGQNIIDGKANIGLSNLSEEGQGVIDSKADVNLSNLSEQGQSIIDSKANINLSNLSDTGQAIIDGKANTDLSNLSTAGQDIIDSKADVDLSNLSSTGEEEIINLTKPFWYDDASRLIFN